MDRHTLAVSQSQGNATADYPPSPFSCIQTPSFLPSHILRLFSRALQLCLHTHFCPVLAPPVSEWLEKQPSACRFRLFLTPAVCFSSLLLTGKSLSCVSSGVKWLHGYKYDTAHKQVLGYKGLAYTCTTPSFSCAAWITYCTAETSILCRWAIRRNICKHFRSSEDYFQPVTDQ